MVFHLNLSSLALRPEIYSHLLAAALGDVLRARVALVQHDGHEHRHVGTQRVARAHQAVALVLRKRGGHARPRRVQHPPGNARGVHIKMT